MSVKPQDITNNPLITNRGLANIITYGMYTTISKEVGSNSKVAYSFSYAVKGDSGISVGYTQFDGSQKISDNKDYISQKNNTDLLNLSKRMANYIINIDPGYKNNIGLNTESLTKEIYNSFSAKHPQIQELYNGTPLNGLVYLAGKNEIALYANQYLKTAQGQSDVTELDYDSNLYTYGVLNRNINELNRKDINRPNSIAGILSYDNINSDNPPIETQEALGMIYALVNQYPVSLRQAIGQLINQTSPVTLSDLKNAFLNSSWGRDNANYVNQAYKDVIKAVSSNSLSKVSDAITSLYNSGEEDKGYIGYSVVIGTVQNGSSFLNNLTNAISVIDNEISNGLAKNIDDKTPQILSDYINKLYGNQYKIQNNMNIAKKSIDPIIINTDNEGFGIDNLSSLSVYYDYSNQGIYQKTAWIGSGTYFLVTLDDKGNPHLIGNNTISGYQQLNTYDVNKDGIINISDDEYSKLYLWDGKNINNLQSGDIVSLKEFGISSISLTQQEQNENINGSRLVSISTVTYNDGTTTNAGEVELNTSTTYTITQKDQSLSDGSLIPIVSVTNQDGSLSNIDLSSSPNIHGYGVLSSLTASMIIINEDGSQTLNNALYQDIRTH